VELEHKAYWALKLLNINEATSGEKRKLQLLELEEIRMNAYESSKIYKKKIKVYHDKKLQRQTFHPGQRRQNLVNHLASVPNVQAVKTRKSECRFPQGLCFVLVLDNFQFIRGKDKMRYKR